MVFFERRSRDASFAGSTLNPLFGSGDVWVGGWSGLNLWAFQSNDAKKYLRQPVPSLAT